MKDLPTQSHGKGDLPGDLKLGHQSGAAELTQGGLVAQLLRFQAKQAVTSQNHGGDPRRRHQDSPGISPLLVSVCFQPPDLASPDLI